MARTQLGAECCRLKLKCSRVLWPCTSCVKRGCKKLCPNGTLAPSGRTIKTVKERNSLSKRVDILEQLMCEN
ncbi:BQ5605_C006g04021 [Microbotryum silenes-dioicae]|uniref:BQ5605_C006g04021 protein n=1 Tax=Microbotryum silenes-dioicae TaxID=796604 RepID=A0A2X0P862_9BASI|nr:BQ5605_C006g04021 [Microbotryum silenes-dioicae]